MLEVFSYAAVIGLGLGIGLKTAEGIVWLLDAFTLRLITGPKITKPSMNRPDTGSTTRF